MKLHLVSIIIINWNGGSILKDCLESLNKLDYKNFEILLIDNASTDGSVDDLKYSNLKIKVIKNSENVGFAPANNQGIKLAKGKYVLLLNNDTKVKKDLLDVLVSKMETDESIGAVQPKIFLMDKEGYLDNAGSFITKIGFLHHWGFNKADSKEFDNEKEIFSAKGACMLIRKSVIDNVGLFDKDYVSYFEESDFCHRIWLSGKKVIYYPKTYIYHKLGFTIKRQNVLKLNYHYYKNRICSLIKNLSPINLVIILPVHLFISLGIASAFLLRGSFQNFLIIMRAIWWNFVNISTTLKKRKNVQKLRQVGDGEIFRRVGYNVDWFAFFNDFKRVEKDISG